MTYLTDEMLLAFLDGIIADGGSVLAYQARATVKDLLVERAARQQPVATSQRTQPKANFNVGQEIEVMKTLQEEIAALADRHPKHMISIDVDQAGQAFCIFFVDGELPSEAMRVRGLNALDEMIATLKAASIVKTTPSPQREESESIPLHTKGAVDAVAGNYVCDREVEPTTVRFADGRIVRVVGDGYLEIERANDSV